MASQKSVQNLKCLDGWRVRAGASREQPPPQGARVRVRPQAHGMAPRTAALLLMMMMELAAAAAAGSGATPRALQGAAASPDTKRLLARLWRVHPRHAGYKEQRRPLKLMWAGAYEGNRSRFDHAVGRSEADVSYAGGATAQRWWCVGASERQRRRAAAPRARANEAAASPMSCRRARSRTMRRSLPVRATGSALTIDPFALTHGAH